MNKVLRQIKKIVVATVGFVVLAVGIIAIPYPGPGWLIVFTGLGILSTEFDWAKRLLVYLRDKFDAWNNWIKQQSRFVKLLTTILTALLVVLTIWLINGYGLINGWFNLHLDWLQSPLSLFHK